MSRFVYFFGYLSLINFLKGECTILSNLAIKNSIFLASEEEVERRFSLIPRLFAILTKNLLNVWANFPSSCIIFVPSTRVMLFLDFNLLPKISFSVFQNFLKSIKLLFQYFHSRPSWLFSINIHKHFFVFCICSLIPFFYLLKTFFLILTVSLLLY